MQARKVNNGYVIVLNKGESVVSSLIDFARENKIPSASLNGLGVLKNIRLGFYHLERKQYDERFFPAEYELLNLTGNISWHENNPVVHCHVVLADPEFNAKGGHLFEAEVGITLELYMGVRELRVERKADDEIGLNLQKL